VRGEAGASREVNRGTQEWGSSTLRLADGDDRGSEQRESDATGNRPVAL
jgi:hypothetical protein